MDNKKLIVFICNTDYANVRTSMSYLINKYSTKYKSKIICIRKHSYYYSICHDYDLYRSKYRKMNEAIEYIKNADIIYWAEEGQAVFLNKRIPNFAAYISNKKKIIGHSGSIYRKNFKYFNNNDLLKYSYQILNTDLYYLSNNNNKIPLIQCTLTNPINTEEIINRYSKNDKLIISHMPSNIKTKGTNIISKIINRILSINNNVIYLENKVKTKHSKIMELKKNTHIYIDQYNLQIGGFGVSGLEGLANGSIVLSSINKVDKNIWNILNIEPPPIIDIGVSTNELYNIIDNLVKKPKEELLLLSLNSVAWYTKYLYGKNYVDLIEKTIFDKLLIQ